MEIRFSQLWQSLRTMTYPHCYWTASNKFSYNSSCYNYLLEFKWMFRIIFTSNLNCFNLDIYCIVCVKSIFFHKSFNLDYPFQLIKNLKFTVFGESDKYNQNIANSLLAWLLYKFLWNIWATNVLDSVFKNSVKLFMSKIKNHLN